MAIMRCISCSLIRETSSRGQCAEGKMFASLQSPPTQSRAVDAELLSEVLTLFGIAHATRSTPDASLDTWRCRPSRISLKHRADLSTMNYELNAGRELMRKHQLVTIMLVHAEAPQRFHSRNAFCFRRSLRRSSHRRRICRLRRLSA